MGRVIYKAVIPLQPVTKKNHGRLVKAKNGRLVMIPSKAYVDYEKKAKEYLPTVLIEDEVNVSAKFYMQTRRRVDLVNLLQALCDTLVAAGVIVDDNCRIVGSFDDCKVLYDKDNPRTEIVLETEE